MNSLDLTLLLIIGISLAVSTFRGAVREIFSLGGVVAGFILASRFYEKTSLGILRLTSYPEINNIISFLVIFIFSSVLISFIGGMFSHAVNKSGFKVLNTFLGTFIGAVKGVLDLLPRPVRPAGLLPGQQQHVPALEDFPICRQVLESHLTHRPDFFPRGVRQKTERDQRSTKDRSHPRAPLTPAGHPPEAQKSHPKKKI